MVNRVFCYSEEEAKKSGNSMSIIKMIFEIIMIILLMSIVLIVFIDSLTKGPMLLLAFIFIFTIVIIFFAMNFAFKFKIKLTGFATDDSNNVYCVTKLNNGEEFVIGGMAAGNIIDKVLGENNSFAGNAMQFAGTAMTLYSVNQSAKIMQNPEIIAKTVENATSTTGAEVKQIIKVYNYTDNSHKVKIRCDYKIMRTGKIKYNKVINVYKSYNCFNDLINIILNVRGNENVLQ